jgi:hypothetical protein
MQSLLFTEVPTRWIVATIALLALAIRIDESQRRVLCVFVVTPRSIAKATVGKYANEAYPQWRENNPHRTCPASLSTLNTYMNNADGRDPWDHRYIMTCAPHLPPGVTGIAVMSVGPDGIYGSRDDLASWN